MGAEQAIMTEGLAKRFGAVQALAGVDLAVSTGEVLGLLGPNGAGKTTLVRILATLLRPDQGRAQVCGLDVVGQPQAVRRLVGLSGQYAAVDAFLTGRENLRMIGRLAGLPRRAARRRAQETPNRSLSRPKAPSCGTFPLIATIAKGGPMHPVPDPSPAVPNRPPGLRRNRGRHAHLPAMTLRQEWP
jgi:ABC-type sugar transport system ATPase subunit